MEELIEVYRQSLDLKQAVFSRIDHNDTMVAEVYRVDLPSEKPLILKICTGVNAYQRELYFLRTLIGLLPVPKVVKIAEPTAGRSGAILMECCEGSLIQECDWTDKLAYEVGSYLALLHSKRTTHYGDFAQKKSQTQNARDYFAWKFFEELEECVYHLPKEKIKFCKEYYESNKYLLNSVDGPCMIHRDFRPGNMIAHHGRLIGIIDWASASFGFAEQDFCSMEHRNWPSNPKYKLALLDGYKSFREVPNYQAIMPLIRLGRALAVIGFTVNSGTWDGKDKEIYQYNRKFIDGFFV